MGIGGTGVALPAGIQGLAKSCHAGGRPSYLCNIVMWSGQNIIQIHTPYSQKWTWMVCSPSTSGPLTTLGLQDWIPAQTEIPTSQWILLCLARTWDEQWHFCLTTVPRNLAMPLTHRAEWSLLEGATRPLDWRGWRSGSCIWLHGLEQVETTWNNYVNIIEYRII